MAARPVAGGGLLSRSTESEAPKRVRLGQWLTDDFALPASVIHVPMRTIRAVELKSPVSSVARGLLGKRLRELFCTAGVTCSGDVCADPGRCDYGRVFETPAALVEGAHGRDSVRPYWCAGLPVATRLAPGEALDVRLTVVGPAIALAPYFHVALMDSLKVRARPVGADDDGPSAESRPPLHLSLASPTYAEARWGIHGDRDAQMHVCVHAMTRT